MKYYIILLCVAGLCIDQATAQENERASFQIGIKAGGNYSNVYDAEAEDFNTDGKLGFVAGGFMSIPLGSMFGIQPEVLFSQKGFKAEGRLLGSSYKLTRTTNFIDVPIFFTVKPIDKLTILLGPQFSYLTKQKDVLENSLTSVEQIKEFNNENLRKNILGASFGLNFNLSKIVFGARACFDLYTNHGDGTSTTPRYKNAWVQATVGFRLF